VSSTTHQLTSHLFEFEPHNDLILPGVSEPQRAWRVLRARRVPTRFQAVRSVSPSPLLAREKELRVIADCWRTSLGGAGQIILLTGEAGIGKSRLASSIHQETTPRSHLRIVLQCSAQHSNTALHPVITRLERLLGVSSSELPERISRRLVHFLAATSAPPAVGPVIARLLGISISGPGVNPEITKEQTLSALIAWLDRLSASRRMLLIIEDAQWADPTSRELLDQLVASASAMRLLIVITSRAGYDPDWADDPHVTRIPLGRLSKQHCVAIIHHLSSSQPLPADVIEKIATRSDGVPLFVEELSRAVLGAQASRERVSRTVFSASDIPPTLSDSLAARLDQLGAYKRVAQIGSAIGRSFSADLLRRLSLIEERELELGLERLVEVELVRARGRGERSLFTFKHALIQSAAYESMPRRRRTAVHGRIAEVLQREYTGRRDGTPEILGHHFAEAGLFDRAVSYFQEAGQRAAAGSANIEAKHLFERALQLLSKLPENTSRDELELSLLVALGPVLMLTSGASAEEVETLYERAVLLCDKLPESKLQFAAYWGWWWISKDASKLRYRADRLLRLAEAIGVLELRLQAHHCQWATLFNSGALEPCVHHIQRGLDIYGSGDYRAQGALYGGHDPLVCAHGIRAVALWLMGFPDQASLAIELALKHAEHLQHAGSIGHARDFEIMLLRYRGDAPTLVDKADAMIEFAEAQSFRDHGAKALLFKGWALAKLGHADEGIRLMEAGLASERKMGMREDFPVYYDMLADIHGDVGRMEDALSFVEEAISIADRTGIKYWLAELYRRKGVLLLRRDPDDSANAMHCFELANEIATDQKAAALLLRSTTSQGRLLLKLGRREEGYRRLVAACAALTEGSQSRDVIAARHLLDELS
jgi:predicted ATPase